MPHLTASPAMLTASPLHMQAHTGSLVNDSLLAPPLPARSSSLAPLLAQAAAAAAAAPVDGWRGVKAPHGPAGVQVALEVLLRRPLTRQHSMQQYQGAWQLIGARKHVARGTTKAPLHACKREPRPTAPAHAPSTDKLTALGLSPARCLLLQPPSAMLPALPFPRPPTCCRVSRLSMGLSPKLRISASSLFKVQQQGEEARRSSKGQQGTFNAPHKDKPTPLGFIPAPFLFQPVLMFPALSSPHPPSPLLSCQPPLHRVFPLGFLLQPSTGVQGAAGRHRIEQGARLSASSLSAVQVSAARGSRKGQQGTLNAAHKDKLTPLVSSPLSLSFSSRSRLNTNVPCTVIPPSCLPLAVMPTTPPQSLPLR
ncbi:unnamed protein product [Closterium sp. Naga37s-1]|nr:unnamed protein product [Closterium sp. Naga37s-1]